MSSATIFVFESHVELMLALTLKGAQIMVMKNLSAHKSGGVSELIEERGCASSSTCRPIRLTSTPWSSFLQDFAGTPVLRRPEMLLIMIINGTFVHASGRT